MQRFRKVIPIVLALAGSGPVVVSGSPVGAAERQRAPASAWQPCAEDPTAQCGTVSVPVDWSRPDGPRIELALARRPATDPEHRVGALVVNPGGPGISGRN